MAERSWEGDICEVASWLGRQGQRGSRRNGPSDAGRNWVHRADLRRAEQDRLRTGQKLVRNIRESISGQRDGGSRLGQKYAGGFPGVDYQRARKGCLSDLQLHLAADTGKVERGGKGKNPGRFPDLDGGRWS